jgi:hypothetical protein
MRTVLAIVFLLGVLVEAQPASACTRVYVDAFSLWEQADAVGLARATAVADGKPATVKLQRGLRGKPPRTLEVAQNMMCGPTFQQGERFVAFFRADGTLSEKLPATFAQALEQWRVTKAGSPRIALLARLAKSKDEALALAATTRRGIEERALLKSDHQRR